MKLNTAPPLCLLGGFALVLAFAPLAGAQSPAGPPPKPPAPPAPLSNDQASYLFGLTFGEQLRSIGVTNEIVPEAVVRGIKEALQGKKSTQADRQQVQEFAHALISAQQTRNEKAAKEFLERNGKEKDVKTTASGLQYKVIAPGDAKAPAIASTDQVTVNYRGKLLDGSEFDSSYARGTPATFPVNGVIKGWQEALVMMKPGAKWDLYVPPDLAYGPNPRPGIPGNSVLIFNVELLSVAPKADSSEPKAAAPGGARPPKSPQPPTP